MDLVVARRNLAGRIEQQGAVDHACIQVGPDDGRTDQDRFFQRTRQFPRAGDENVGILGGDARGLVVGARLHEVGAFGRQDELRPGRRRLADQGRDVIERRRRRRRRPRLHQGDIEPHQAARSGSSRPRDSSAIRSSHPPTCRSSMKICG